MAAARWWRFPASSSGDITRSTARSMPSTWSSADTLNGNMWNFLFFKSFGQGLVDTARICWTTVKLAWKAAPVLLVGVLLLFGVESGLAPLQLALTRAVIDRLAAS